MPHESESVRPRGTYLSGIFGTLVDWTTSPESADEHARLEHVPLVISPRLGICYTHSMNALYYPLLRSCICTTWQRMVMCFTTGREHGRKTLRP